MFEKGNRANTLHGILLIALFSFAAFYIAEIPFVKSLSFSPLIVGIIWVCCMPTACATNSLKHGYPVLNSVRSRFCVPVSYSTDSV